jgi:hypothetical protein
MAMMRLSCAVRPRAVRPVASAFSSSTSADDELDKEFDALAAEHAASRLKKGGGSSRRGRSQKRNYARLHMRRDILKSFALANQDHEAKAAAMGLGWELAAATIIERNPQVTADLPEWERQFMAVQDSIAYYKQRDWPAGLGLTHPDEIDPDDPSTAVHPSCCETTSSTHVLVSALWCSCALLPCLLCPDLLLPPSAAMSLPFDLAPRVTEADETNDTKSLERALPEVRFGLGTLRHICRARLTVVTCPVSLQNLYLMLQGKGGNGWSFPQVKRAFTL